MLVQGTAGTDFPNISGNLTDPVPCRIKNEAAAGGTVVYIGGSDVSASNGTSLAGQESFTANLYGTSEIPYAFAVGTPTVSVLLGRQ